MKRTAFRKADRFLGRNVALVLFFASGRDHVQSPERLACDWGVRASSHAPSTRVVVVAVDDQSIANIGRWPWSRDIHSHMIGMLKPQNLAQFASVLGEAKDAFNRRARAQLSTIPWTLLSSGCPT